MDQRTEDDGMERMESMEPISAHYTTAYPEIQPDSGYESRETADGQGKTPPAPTYDEELVHKVRRWLNSWFKCDALNFGTFFKDAFVSLVFIHVFTVA